jgi:hypothetical protein
VTLIVGGLASIGVIITWQQKNRADRRSEWWRRTTWAFERTFSVGDTEAELGWKVLFTLVRSKLATADDSEIIQVIAEHVALGAEQIALAAAQGIMVSDAEEVSDGDRDQGLPDQEEDRA